MKKYIHFHVWQFSFSFVHLFNFSFSKVIEILIPAGHPYYLLLSFFMVLKNPRKNLAIHNSVWNFKTDHYKLAKQEGWSDVNNFGIILAAWQKFSMTKLSQDKLRRSGIWCFEPVWSNFLMPFKFKVDFTAIGCRDLLKVYPARAAHCSGSGVHYMT